MDYEERSKKSYQVDMTTGSLIKNVLWFVLPICLGNILQQLYGIVDTLVIGKFCGANSLAAVGTSTCLLYTSIRYVRHFIWHFRITIQQRHMQMDLQDLETLLNYSQKESFTHHCLCH